MIASGSFILYLCLMLFTMFLIGASKSKTKQLSTNFFYDGTFALTHVLPAEQFKFGNGRNIDFFVREKIHYHFVIME